MNDTYQLLGVDSKDILTLEKYLQDYFTNILKKLKDLKAQSKQTDIFFWQEGYLQTYGYIFWCRSVLQNTDEWIQIFLYICCCGMCKKCMLLGYVYRIPTIELSGHVYRISTIQLSKTWSLCRSDLNSWIHSQLLLFYNHAF